MKKAKSDAIGARMRKVRTECNLSQDDFAEQVGGSRSSITRYENGTSSPDAGILEEIVLQYRVNGHWLLTGDGPMHCVRELESPESATTQFASSEQAQEIKRLRAMLAQEEAVHDVSMLHQVGELERLQQLSTLGYQAGIWHVLRVLADVFPEECQESRVVKEIGKRFGSTHPEDVSKYLHLLEQAGLVDVVGIGSEKLYTYRVPIAEVITSDLVQESQLASEAVRDFVEGIAPAVSQDHDCGQIINGFLRIPEGEGRAVVREIVKAVRHTWSKAARKDGPEEVLLVMGVAVTGKRSR